MIDSLHISDSSIYGLSWTTPELRNLFSEQARVKGWLEVMAVLAVLAETQAQFALIPEQAALEIRAYYEQLQIDDAFLQEIGQHYATTNHSLMGLIKAVQARCQPVGGEWLCYGATVQDITDTHTMRVLKLCASLLLSNSVVLNSVCCGWLNSTNTRRWQDAHTGKSVCRLLLVIKGRCGWMNCIDINNDWHNLPNAWMWCSWRVESVVCHH